jgi:hypothetical protein
MLTKADAIKAGQAIARAATKATEEKNNEKRWAARGACVDAINNFWYDVMPMALRGKFDYNSENFYKAIGWPE